MTQSLDIPPVPPSFGPDTTETRILWLLWNRPENANIETPDEVNVRREFNDLVKMVREIDRNTRTIPSLAKTIRNMFAKAVGDLDDHVLKK